MNNALFVGRTYVLAHMHLLSEKPLSDPLYAELSAILHAQVLCPQSLQIIFKKVNVPFKVAIPFGANSN
jgi:hypothetical protein